MQVTLTFGTFSASQLYAIHIYNVDEIIGL